MCGSNSGTDVLHAEPTSSSTPLIWHLADKRSLQLVLPGLFLVPSDSQASEWLAGH